MDKLEEVAPLNAVRILDALFVAKEDNGDLVAQELGDHGEEEGDDVLGVVIGALLGFSFEGGDPDAPPAEITEASAIGVSVADIRRIARDLAPGTAAGLWIAAESVSYESPAKQKSTAWLPSPIRCSAPVVSSSTAWGD